MMHCIAQGHTIVALGNLHPLTLDECDSFMYQSVGHQLLAETYQECLGLPLYRQEITGSCINASNVYDPQEKDEVEDLFRLLNRIKSDLPDVQAVSTGAILSNYQRVRVEHVCKRLGLVSLAYLWQQPQEQLLPNMIHFQLDSIFIKVACMGLNASHLGKSLKQMHPIMMKLNQDFGAHICGEGGEYETLTLDCPLFIKKIIIDEVDVKIHSDDAFAPVCYLIITKYHLESKENSHLPITERLSPILKQELIKSSMERMQPSIPSCSFALTTVESALGDSNHVSKASSWIHDPVYYWDTCCFALSSLSISHFMSLETLASLSIEQEIEILMTKIQSLLSQCDLTWNHVVQIHVYVSDMQLFARMNTVYAQFFGNNPPTRVTFSSTLIP